MARRTLQDWHPWQGRAADCLLARGAATGTTWLHADAETKEDKPQRVVVCFGPEHAPIDKRIVERAIEEAQTLIPKPKIIAFAAFQFDPEAAKDIDETKWPGVNLLKVQMNADLLTEDLKKKRASNESFWLIGQPDVQVTKIKEGADAGRWRAEVSGFDCSPSAQVGQFEAIEEERIFGSSITAEGAGDEIENRSAVGRGGEGGTRYQAGCMSSEPFGQVGNGFKRGSGPSELKLWLQSGDAAGVVARWFSAWCFPSASERFDHDRSRHRPGSGC